MDKREWGGKFNRGDSWRSDVAYQCKVCHTKTNKVIMGGYPGMGPRIICPADAFPEHDELESALAQYQSLDIQIQDFEQTLRESSQIDRGKAGVMRGSLSTQRALLEVKVNRLRKVFSGRLDDVEGLNSDASTIDFYPTLRHATKKKLLY